MLIIIELTTSMKFIGLLVINLKFEIYLVIFIFKWNILLLYFSYDIAFIETILHKMNFSLLIIVLIALFQTITDIKGVSQDNYIKMEKSFQEK